MNRAIVIFRTCTEHRAKGNADRTQGGSAIFWALGIIVNLVFSLPIETSLDDSVTEFAEKLVITKRLVRYRGSGMPSSGKTLRLVIC